MDVKSVLANIGIVLLYVLASMSPQILVPSGFGMTSIIISFFILLIFPIIIRFLEGKYEIIWAGTKYILIVMPMIILFVLVPFLVPFLVVALLFAWTDQKIDSNVRKILLVIFGVLLVVSLILTLMFLRYGAF